MVREWDGGSHACGLLKPGVGPRSVKRKSGLGLPAGNVDSVRNEGAVRICQPNGVSRGAGRADGGSLLLGWGRAGSVTQNSSLQSFPTRIHPVGVTSWWPSPWMSPGVLALRCPSQRCGSDLWGLRLVSAKPGVGGALQRFCSIASPQTPGSIPVAFPKKHLV